MMAPGKGKPLVASNGSPPPATPPRQKSKSAAIDGLLADLAQKVSIPFETAAEAGHLDGIRTIHRLLLQIQKLERAANLSPLGPNAEARLNILRQWLVNEGLKIDGLQLAPNLGEGCGVVADRVFEKEELIVSVPASSMMTTAYAMRSTEDVGLLVRGDPIVRAFPSLVLTLHLLFEKHRPADQPSRWAGYIASLPGQSAVLETNMDDDSNFIMPLAFSMETYQALEGTELLGGLHRTLRNFVRQYTHVRKLLRALAPHYHVFQHAISWFTWAEFRWAASIVSFRQNNIPPPEGEKETYALIPVLDMFNNKEDGSPPNFDVPTQSSELRASKRIEAGEQIYMTYGKRSTSQLLIYGGFVPTTNPHNVLKLNLELDSSDPLQAKKLALLKWLNLPNKGQLDLLSGGVPSKPLAQWAHVAAMTDIAEVNEVLRKVIASRTKKLAKAMEEEQALQTAAQAKARTNGHIASIQVRGASAGATSAKINESSKPVGRPAGLGIGGLSVSPSKDKANGVAVTVGNAVTAVASASPQKSSEKGEATSGLETLDSDKGTSNPSNGNSATFVDVNCTNGTGINGAGAEGERVSEGGSTLNGNDGKSPPAFVMGDDGEGEMVQKDEELDDDLVIADDARAIEWLARLCELRLRAYPTLTEERLAFLEGKDGVVQKLRGEMAMALRGRQHEEAILRSAVDRAKAASVRL